MQRRTRTAVTSVTKDELLVNLNARVPKQLWHRVRVQCTREGLLLREFITEALEDHLRRTRAR